MSAAPALILDHDARKQAGAFYTPPDAVQALVRWAVRHSDDLMLDPACGDGRFLAAHANSTGVEQDSLAHALARKRAPLARIHEGDFFDVENAPPKTGRPKNVLTYLEFLDQVEKAYLQRNAAEFHWADSQETDDDEPEGS